MGNTVELQPPGIAIRVAMVTDTRWEEYLHVTHYTWKLHILQKNLTLPPRPSVGDTPPPLTSTSTQVASRFLPQHLFAQPSDSEDEYDVDLNSDGTPPPRTPPNPTHSHSTGVVP